jgi:molybdate transport system permease protein
MQKRPFRLGTMALVIIGSVMVLFLTLPILVLAVRGVQTRGWEKLGEAGILDAIRLSALTTAISSLITFLFGTPLAYVLAKGRFRFRRVVVALVELPIILPPAVAGLALLVTFGRRGLLGPTLQLFGINLPFTTAAVVLAQTFVAAPFYIRSAQVGFQGISPEIEDAARVDGAAGLTLFRYVTLPLTRRALAAGLTLSWARALGEFGATIMFAGSLSGRTQTMTLFVYGVFESNLEAAIWTSLILIGLALVALLHSQWLMANDPDTTS